MSRTSRFPLRGALAGAALLALLVGSVPARAGDVTVKVGHNRLEPAEVTIGVGDRVTWVNEDAMPGGHTVAALDGRFESPPLAVGESFSHTFGEPGGYRYHIREHPEAEGTVLVE